MINDIGIVKIIERCTMLQSLSVSGCFKITEIGRIAEGCPHLQRLNLTLGGNVLSLADDIDVINGIRVRAGHADIQWLSRDHL
jgi:hypothetical protein